MIDDPTLGGVDLTLQYTRFWFILPPCAPLFFTSMIMHQSKAEKKLRAGRRTLARFCSSIPRSLCGWFSCRAILQCIIIRDRKKAESALFLIPRCEMLIAEPVGQLRSLHWRSAYQLHRRSSCTMTCVVSTTKYFIDRIKRPTFYRLFAAPPLYSLFVALAVLALIRPCSACEIVDLPQSSYSFNGCYNGCATAGNTHVLIKLDSVQAWSAVVRLHINIFTNGMPFSCVANKYVLSVFTAVLQAADVNQWVKADLGAESLVCGVTTQGRGESIHIIGCNKPEHLISRVSSRLSSVRIINRACE
jgi:hypothetical protein